MVRHRPNPGALSAGARAGWAALAGIVVGGGVSAAVPWQAAALVGWDAGAVVLLLLVWLGLAAMSPTAVAEHASREDPSRALADVIVVGACVAFLAAVGLALVKAGHTTGGAKAFLIAVAVTSVALAWGVVHTVFALRYARLYYSPPTGGVDFKEPEEPGYLDFAYLAFTIGMTFQVSDTDLTAKPVRRTALRHALISYLFGAVVLGLAINVVGSLLG